MLEALEPEWESIEVREYYLAIRGEGEGEMESELQSHRGEECTVAKKMVARDPPCSHTCKRKAVAY